MKLSNERIKSLKTILKESCGLDLTEVQAQEAGLTIMRYVISKTQREKHLAKYKGNENGQIPRTNRITAK